MSGKTPGHRIGSHLSIAKGFAGAVAEAARLGCETLQVFTKSTNRWAARPLARTEIEEFRRAVRREGIFPVLGHAGYLLNLASPDPRLYERSIRALRVELARAAALGLDGLVIHPGSHMGAGADAGIGRVARALDRVLGGAGKGGVPLLLETAAGQGTSLGSRFEEIKGIIGSTSIRVRPRLGVCLDTAHVHAAGYDLDSDVGYAKTLGHLLRTLGKKSILAVHLNDSKSVAGSRVDRHEHLGKGAIGARALARFLADRRLSRLPFILETPKGKDERGRDFDAGNLRAAKRLRGHAGARPKGRIATKKTAHLD